MISCLKLKVIKMPSTNKTSTLKNKLKLTHTLEYWNSVEMDCGDLGRTAALAFSSNQQLINTAEVVIRRK